VDGVNSMADGVIADFDRKCAAPDWRRLSEDFLIPGSPTSHTAGWSNFVDARSKPERRVYQWQGQWADQAGGAVVVGLTYRAETADPDAVPASDLDVGIRCFSGDAFKKAGIQLPNG